MRPILAIALAVLLGLLIYSQRDVIWDRVTEEVEERRQARADSLVAVDSAAVADSVRAEPAPVERDSALAAARFRDGVRAYEAGDLEAAETAFREAVKYGPEMPLAFDHLGLIMSRQGRYEEAREAFLESAALDSTSLGTLVHLVTTCAQLGRREEAEAFLKRAEALAPGNPRLEGLRSVLEKREGLPDGR